MHQDGDISIIDAECARCTGTEQLSRQELQRIITKSRQRNSADAGEVAMAGQHLAWVLPLEE
jgi:Zn-finger nucleic acid-binding protein